MMLQAIDEFLRTDEAKKMGFDSKADVVTAAVRGLLTEYNYYRGAERRKLAARGKTGSTAPNSSETGLS
jgi:hypothetical protein